MKPIINLDAEYYLKRIRKNAPFQLSRFGDGEVLCMQLATLPLRCNCDGSAFTQELINPMRQIFKNNYNYFHCLLDCSFSLHANEFRRFIDTTCPSMEFYDGEIWQKLSFNNSITELTQAIAPYNPCFIGGSHIHNVKYMKGLESGIRFIETPEKNAYDSFERIFTQCMNMHLAGCRMFLFSCGYTSKILIDTLFPYIGHDSFIIDAGSVFDPYCGKLSRDGMKYYGFKKFQPYTNLKLS